MLIATLSIALVARVRFVMVHEISILDVFQAGTLDTAQFKATEVPRPTADSEATAPLVFIVGGFGGVTASGQSYGRLWKGKRASKYF